MISEHNAEFEAGEHTFNIGENELADLTPDEIKERMNGLSHTSKSKWTKTMFLSKKRNRDLTRRLPRLRSRGGPSTFN